MSVLTDKATYQATTVLNQTYVDATARTDADAATRVVAEWAKEVRDGLFALNDAANGELSWTEAGIICRVAGAPATGFNVGLDDLVVGPGTDDRGVSVYAGTTNFGFYGFRNQHGTRDGGVRYSNQFRFMDFWVTGSPRVSLTAVAFAPSSSQTLGTSAARWGDFYTSGAINHTGSTLGFFSATPAAKPTVTGSRGGNAALASLITALATLGLVTDSTT